MTTQANGAQRHGSPPGTETASGRLVIGLMRLAGPIIVSRAGHRIMQFVDIIMVGQFAAAELAVMTLGLAVFHILMVANIGLLMGTLIISAHSFGAGTVGQAGAAWRRGVSLALLTGCVTGALCQFGEPMLLLLGQDAKLAADGGRIMAISGFGLPALALFMVCTYFLDGIRRPVPIMVIMLAAQGVNALLNWVLIYGHLGLPALGAPGAAWATVAARTAMAAAALAWVWWLSDRARFAVRHRPPGGWRAWERQRRYGYAAAGSTIIEVTAFSAMEIFAGWIGPLVLAAFGMVRNLIGITFMVAYGVGSATGVLVGNAYGRRDWPELAKAGWVGLVVAAAVPLVPAAVLLLAPAQVAGLFTTEAPLIATAIPLLMFTAPILVVDGIQGAMANALRGRGETWTVTLLHLIAFWGIMIPACWVLGFPLSYGAEGILSAVLLATVAACVLAILRFRTLTRRDARSGTSSKSVSA